MSQFSFKQFTWARAIITTRNFGAEIIGIKEDLIVPIADMINHGRPNNCAWSYDDEQSLFTVTATEVIWMF